MINIYTYFRFYTCHKPKLCDKTVEKGKINIFGHIHNHPFPMGFDDNAHFCISLEKTNYYPIILENVIKKS